MDPLKRNIILASQSPRRRQLLDQAGFNFVVRPQNIEETYPDDLRVVDVAPFLAHKKANVLRPHIEEDEIILAADSVVILDGIIYGKPEDKADARRILQKLSGRVHQVITGVCLMDRKKEKVFSSLSKVHFLPLSDSEIDFYIDHYQPFDKAGSYAIQEWIGLCKIEHIEGTYANVMGLPVHLVYQHLSAW
jgi:septum formation protein